MDVTIYHSGKKYIIPVRTNGCTLCTYSGLLVIRDPDYTVSNLFGFTKQTEEIYDFSDKKFKLNVIDGYNFTIIKFNSIDTLMEYSFRFTNDRGILKQIIEMSIISRLFEIKETYDLNLLNAKYMKVAGCEIVTKYFENLPVDVAIHSSTGGGNNNPHDAINAICRSVIYD